MKKYPMVCCSHGLQNWHVGDQINYVQHKSSSILYQKRPVISSLLRVTMSCNSYCPIETKNHKRSNSDHSTLLCKNKHTSYEMHTIKTNWQKTFIPFDRISQYDQNNPILDGFRIITVLKTEALCWKRNQRNIYVEAFGSFQKDGYIHVFWNLISWTRRRKDMTEFLTNLQMHIEKYCSV